ncbi:MAG: cytidine deaminase [Ruminococcus sp.]|nr:cytidine deaminase [Ruminococcus sp.]
MSEERDYRELLAAARRAAEHSHSPYSHFRVGAAVLTRSGKVYTGCNIENISYPLCNCAERTALFKAVSEGEDDFEAIAVVGSSGEDFSQPCFPCGACLQVISEFSGENELEMKIVLSDRVRRLSDHLPVRFTKKNLETK